MTDEDYDEYDVLSVRYVKFEGPKVQLHGDVKARDLGW